MLFFFSSRRRHTRFDCDWSSDVCSSDLRIGTIPLVAVGGLTLERLPGVFAAGADVAAVVTDIVRHLNPEARDRKSTRLNSSHSQISYAVFCLKKKNKTIAASSLHAHPCQ